MSEIRESILAWLATDAQVSGAELAEHFGITRAGIARHIARLRADGWEITGQAGAGYRLEGPGRPLRRAVIEEELAAADGRIHALEILRTVDSTSTRLASGDLPGGGMFQVCLADQQTAGRGRRGRRWQSEPGCGIVLSVGTTSEFAPADLVPMGLVVAVAVADAIHAACGVEVNIKWPNDLEVNGAKLGGILVDLTGEAAGPTRVVVGIGVNHDLGGVCTMIDDRCVTDLARAAPAGEVPGREVVAAAILRTLVAAWDRFVTEGFAPFRSALAARDCLVDRRIRIDTAPGSHFTGIARGVDDIGALCVDVDGHRRRFFSGDVSVRTMR